MEKKISKRGGKRYYEGVKVDEKGKREKIGVIRAGMWVGIPDAWEMIENLNTKVDAMHWWVSLEITKSVDGSPIRALKFDVVKLNKKVFEARKVGPYFRQSVYAHWLEDAIRGLEGVEGTLKEIYYQTDKEGPEMVKQGDTEKLPFVR